MSTVIKALVPIPEARQILGDIGNSMIYELIKRREVTKVKIGRRGFITAESLESYINRLSAAGVAEDHE